MTSRPPFASFSSGKEATLLAIISAFIPAFFGSANCKILPVSFAIPGTSVAGISTAMVRS
jgi:hypothetical protein